MIYMRTKTRGMLTLLLAFVVHLSFAQEKTNSGTVKDSDAVPLPQEKTISGTVKDFDAVPLPGVNILVQGTTNGTQTDFDGNYSINASKGQTLVFTYIGLRDVRRTVGAGTAINVQMQEDAEALDEVVVTGTGVATSRRKTAIAVASVKADELRIAPAGDISQALIGKVPGALIQSTTGQPGQQQSILLRGINSLGSTQPMILVDGIQINTDNLDNGGGNNLSSRLADLDLGDVDRVEVIQGAAAGTIYGAQGANGVIQIFTKKGKAGKMKVNLRSTIGFSTALEGNFGIADRHYYDTTADGFLANASGGRLLPNPETGVWGTPVGSIDANTLVDNPFGEQTFDNLDLLLRDGVVTSNTGVSVSGGSEQVTFVSSLSYLDQESVIVGSLKRINFRNSVTANITDKLSATISATVISSDNTTGGVTNADNNTGGFSNSILVPQFINNRALDAAGNFVALPTGDTSVNPFFTQQNRFFSSDLIRVIGNVNLNYKPFEFLEVDYKYGADIYENRFRQLTFNQSELLTQGLPPLNGQLIERPDKGTTQNSLLSAFLRFDFEDDFGFSNFPMSLTTQIAYDWRREDFQRITVTGTELPTFSDNFNLNQSGNQSATGEDSTFRTYGFLVNQRFDYGDYLGFSAGVRVDYSSAFGVGSEPFVFPRGDVYLRLDSFVEKDWLNQFKLRAGYGEAGIQPGAFDRIPTLGAGQIDATAILSLPNTLRNQLLNVQSSQELEFGTDITFALSNNTWFNRIDLNATYYTRSSEDAIRAIDVSPSTGAAALLTNALTIDTEGFQAGLNMSVANYEKFRWNSTINFGTFESIVTDIANNADIALGNNHVIREGAAVGAFFGLEVLTSVTQTRTDGSRYIEDANVGNFEIVNGNVVETATRRAVLGDEQVELGDPTPDFNMSLINSFDIGRNLNLSFQFDWIQGGDIYNQTRQWLYRDLLHENVTQPITVGGESGAFAAYYTNLYQTNNPNSEFVEDGTFVRLRNLNLSYDFGEFVNGVSNLRVTLGGENLLTFTEYSGIDPEAVSNQNSAAERGLDQYAFPNFRTISLGLNVTF
jgi:TonB-linked SusC/RagA family outer membrane protein